MSEIVYKLKEVSGDFTECANCGAVWVVGELLAVKDMLERVDPGEPMPDGECPNCGAVCHKAPHPLDRAPRAPLHLALPVPDANEFTFQTIELVTARLFGDPGAGGGHSEEIVAKDELLAEDCDEAVGDPYLVVFGRRAGQADARVSDLQRLGAFPTMACACEFLRVCGWARKRRVVVSGRNPGDHDDSMGLYDIWPWEEPCEVFGNDICHGPMPVNWTEVEKQDAFYCDGRWVYVVNELEVGLGGKFEDKLPLLAPVAQT